MVVLLAVALDADGAEEERDEDEVVDEVHEVLPELDEPPADCWCCLSNRSLYKRRWSLHEDSWTRSSWRCMAIAIAALVRASLLLLRTPGPPAAAADEREVSLADPRIGW